MKSHPGRLAARRSLPPLKSSGWPLRNPKVPPLKKALRVHLNFRNEGEKGGLRFRSDTTAGLAGRARLLYRSAISLTG